jgi:hypothetical protein
MKTILNENGLVTHNTSRANTLEIQATSIRAEEIYQGDQNLVVLIQSLTEKVHSVFDRVLTLTNEVNSLKTQIKESVSEFASYKDLEKLETRLDKELKAVEKANKTQSKTTVKESKEEPVAKQ